MLAINRKDAQKNRLLFSFLVIPTVLMIVFMLFPLVKLMGLSFTDWNGLSDTKIFVGLDNFRKIFFDSPEIWSSLKNNGVYFIFHLLFIPVELFIAFLLDNRVRGCKAFKT
ncbi:carbohydrate ABC transporter permease, partial [Clostridium perfringens]|uniref:carbohydrate ABC transporter permease n=1 Tax=Clostridium perfringens TaxID=1502 RepID=UPI002AD78117|nr:sugar ABC transporter permease [Clostridium perfringens]